MTTTRKLLWAYGAVACLTLIFQIWVRSGQCAGAAACAISFAKGVIWSTIWPLSWAVYLGGMF
jgi:hypothetical protein